MLESNRHIYRWLDKTYAKMRVATIDRVSLCKVITSALPPSSTGVVCFFY